MSPAAPSKVQTAARTEEVTTPSERAGHFILFYATKTGRSVKFLFLLAGVILLKSILCCRFFAHIFFIYFQYLHPKEIKSVSLAFDDAIPALLLLSFFSLCFSL